MFLEPDPERIEDRIIQMEPPDDLPHHWSLMVGEMLHEIRSSLDNLVWFLAEAKSGTAPWPIPSGNPWRSVQFPVYETPQRFADGIQRWRDLVHDDDWTILEQPQPYHGLDPYHLVQITELSNADKHRAMHLLTTYHSDLVNPTVRIGECIDAEVVAMEITQNAGVCRGKTELGRISLRITGPQPYVQVQEQFGFEVAIDHPAIIEMPVVDMGVWMSLKARAIIDLFASRYP